MAFYVGDLRSALPAALGASMLPVSAGSSCGAAAPRHGQGQGQGDTGEALFTVPASMLRALSSTPSRKQSAVSVPVLVLLPVQPPSSSAASLPSLQSLQQQGDGHGLQAALPRLLAANANVGVLQPARSREASITSTTSASSRASSSSLLSASSPPFVPKAGRDDADFDSAESVSETLSDVLPLPSFGERTAAAKQLLSAAPGGPVFGNRWTSGGPIGIDTTPFQSALYLKNQKKSKKVFCPFCKKNGERRETYTAHGLNERCSDGSIRVTCPVLRSLRCEICGSTGDKAHTRTHCPLGVSELPVATILKSTQRRCDGSKRSFVN